MVTFFAPLLSVLVVECSAIARRSTTDQMGRPVAHEITEPTTPIGTVLLVGGLPPSGDVLGLREVLCDVGWRVVTYLPPGATSDSGPFSLARVLGDLATLFAEFGPGLATFGHSAGGTFLLTALAVEDGVSCVGFAGTANFSVMAEAFRDAAAREAFGTTFDQVMANVPSVSGGSFVDEIIGVAHRAAFAALAVTLRGRGILAIAAANDGVVPRTLHHDPMVAALAEAAIDHTNIVLSDNHNFTGDRGALHDAVVAWLARACA